MKGFLNNWELKILALLSAIVLWFFVVGIENNSYRFPDPIEIHAINVPSDMSVANSLGSGIIRIRGDQDVIKNLTKSNFDLSVDLKNAHEGEQDLPVAATSNNDKITVLKVEPTTVHVILEPVTEKDIKVKTVVSGSAARGYRVSNVDATPQTVTVNGGKSLLSKLTSMNAEIKLNGTESTNFKQTVTLKLPDEFSSLNNVTLSPDQVLVEVTIVQDLQQKIVTVKPNFQGSLDLTLMSKKIVITPETVTIQGKEDVLKDIDSVTTEPVSYELLKSSTTPVKAKLILPKGITIPDSQPNAVSISLTAP